MRKTVQLNLRKDAREIYQHLLQRVREYPVYINNGPGEDADDIRQITLGFSYAQSGWIAVVFDTRPDAEVDGTWQNFIEENCIDYPHWNAAWDQVSEGKCQLKVLLPLGKKTDVAPFAEMDEFASSLGQALSGLLIKARDAGEFSSLPVDANCFLTVEDHDGAFGWNTFLDGRIQNESGEETELALCHRIRTLSVQKQIEYWIAQLDLKASEKPSDLDHFISGTNLALDELEAIGEKAVVPLLELCCRWAGQPEWNGDRPRRNFQETPVQDIVVGAVWKINEMNVATTLVEGLLHAIVYESVEANENRRLWGIIPYHTACCLYDLFEGYPKPLWNEKTNALNNPQAYLGALLR
ncbi:hypothetical protein [Gimesia maris]|uniref:hypothetical protein n=1 Tax=Gimesia maris TaxID=122 RepID=UPI0032EEE53A